ncbi:type B 50S ribosomal protein L31 [Salinibius halmophilus]|uniref:type B 50S ribosomal protein L31 n=1 Tax=Salinibius halmophilus TaxID=1853216 RepID=UPI000E6706F0|nr:type B 50S ribosomal protein L31 [Salinibius halmophilus]
MKPNIHPDYQTVVFHDTTANEYFLIKSTLKTERTIDWQDGQTYPYMPLDVSSASHPQYTGKARVVEKEGRVNDFYRKFGKGRGVKK